MAIKFETFLKWAESRFGDVVVKGDEIKVNSVFADEDYKHHMWCSPKGGKHNYTNGVYHCWKSGESGSLIGLVMHVDKCSYEEACETLEAGDYELADLEHRLEQFMNSRTPSTVEDLTEGFAGIKLPEQTFPILSLSADNLWRIEAEEYLKGRKLDPKNYFVCVGGEYKNRIIIPYYDENKKLIYWNGRYLTNTDKVVKYRGPKRDENDGIGKGDVLYISGEWPGEGEEIHFAEGEFDADSVRAAGLYSGALGGKSIEEAQLAIILKYLWNTVLCFDTDLGKKVDAGGEALLKIGDALLRAPSRRGLTVSFVRPPKQFKDWNQMFVAVGPKVMNAYMRREKKPFTADVSLAIKMERSF